MFLKHDLVNISRTRFNPVYPGIRGQKKAEAEKRKTRIGYSTSSAAAQAENKRKNGIGYSASSATA